MQAIIRAKQAGTEKEGEEEMESDLVLRAEEGESTPPAQFKDPLVPATLSRIRAILGVIPLS